MAKDGSLARYFQVFYGAHDCGVSTVLPSPLPVTAPYHPEPLLFLGRESITRLRILMSDGDSSSGISGVKVFCLFWLSDTVGYTTASLPGGILSSHVF